MAEKCISAVSTKESLKLDFHRCCCRQPAQAECSSLSVWRAKRRSVCQSWTPWSGRWTSGEYSDMSTGKASNFHSTNSLLTGGFDSSARGGNWSELKRDTGGHGASFSANEAESLWASYSTNRAWFAVVWTFFFWKRKWRHEKFKTVSVFQTMMHRTRKTISWGAIPNLARLFVVICLQRHKSAVRCQKIARSTGVSFVKTFRLQTIWFPLENNSEGAQSPLKWRLSAGTTRVFV